VRASFAEVSIVHKTLKCLFLLCLFIRLCLVIYFPPTEYLYSDMIRHWENGERLFNPSLMGGVDPKLYQVWIFLMRKLSFGSNHLACFYTGLLSAFFAYTWYLVARELFSKRIAYIFGIILALHPNYSMFYSYFMNETIILPAVGVATWLTLRAERKRNFWACQFALLAWSIAIFARISVVPLAFAGFIYILSFHPSRVRGFGLALVILSAMLIPAGLHSMKGTNIFNPLQFTELNQLYRYTDKKWFQINVKYPDGGVYIGRWATPSYSTNMLAPFGNFETKRQEGVQQYYINFAEGKTSWQQALESQKENYTSDMRWNDFIENLVFFTFGAHFPDAQANSPNFLSRLAFHFRWFWVVVIFAFAVFTPFIKVSAREAYILVSVAITVAALLLQQTGVMEARFRRVIEPDLLISFFIIISSSLRTSAKQPKLSLP
jgi:hypothetical protein